MNFVAFWAILRISFGATISQLWVGDFLHKGRIAERKQKSDKLQLIHFCRYQLAENIDAQLKRMVQDLKEIIDHLNTANSSQDSNYPVGAIFQLPLFLFIHQFG